jgi:hypothetical protein
MKRNRVQLNSRRILRSRKGAAMSRVLRAGRDWERLQAGAAKLSRVPSRTLPATRRHIPHHGPWRKNDSTSGLCRHYVVSVSIVTLRLV